MNNEEVMDVTEEITTGGSNKALKVAAKIGLTVLVGVGVYKLVVRPIIAKAKKRKAKKEIMVETEVIQDSNVNDYEDVE